MDGWMDGRYTIVTCGDGDDDGDGNGYVCVCVCVCVYACVYR